MPLSTDRIPRALVVSLFTTFISSLTNLLTTLPSDEPFTAVANASRKSFPALADESWIDWAIEMIEVGYESMNLYMLAGMLKPYSQFELQELTDNVLRDLDLDYNNEEDVFNNYTYYLLSKSVTIQSIILKHFGSI